MQQVTRELVFHFRNLLHLKAGAGEELELTAEHLKRLDEQAKKFSMERIKEMLRALSRAELDMKWHPHARLVLEVALLELLEARQVSAIRITQDETHVATGQRITQIKEHWDAILENMRKKSIYGFVSLHEGEPIEVNDKGKLVIGFRKGYSFHKDRMEENKNKEALEESIREVVGQKIPIECVIAELNKTPTLSVKSVAEFFEGKVVA